MKTEGTVYSELGLSNDFMFGKIMQNEKICKTFLEQILNLEIDHIEYIESQKTINEKIDARSVRLDIYLLKPEYHVYRSYCTA